LFRAAWAAPIAPAPALAAFFFFDAMALLESAGLPGCEHTREQA
jgi:hypothetical protein